MPFQRPYLLIGVSARIYYPSAPVLDLGGVWTKTLHYLEQSVGHWLLRGGALAVMIPAVDSQSLTTRADFKLRQYAEALDALVLQGGNDVAPQSYGEQPMRPEWAGDPVRDRYEIELIRAFVDAGKPVFGLCRGHQLLNVAFGGTLMQDIDTQAPGPVQHINRNHYERNLHSVHIEPGSHLAELYPGMNDTRINSIHHQGIQTLADGFRIEARCSEDGMIEAIRHLGPTYIAGVQWHPEFHPHGDNGVFDDTPLLNDFLHTARALRRV